MNIPQISGSVVTNRAESHVALVGLYFDFSIVKAPPREYEDIVQLLSPRRRNEAEEGQSHFTASQLGHLFGGFVPKVPNLIRAYGLRCSEIARSPTFNPKGTSQHGLFANEVGADGTAIWAAATSGESAIAVHLLGCILSRMWDPPEAISIWMQLIAERKHVLATSENPAEPPLSRAITLTREQVASWHTSIEAWRRTADEANARRQNQLLLIINNMGIPVNTKMSLSESVLDAWVTAMMTVDKLAAGAPQSVQTGAPLLGLSAWHLYPNMIVFGRGRACRATEVDQNDPLIDRSGILTLGIQDLRRSGDGIYWSLPLAYLRYYGEPVRSEARLSTPTSRASFDELTYMALGSLVRRWLAHTNEIDLAAELLVKFDEYINISGILRRDSSWISLIARFANNFLIADAENKQVKLQYVRSGSRRYPLFVDDPAADTIFGLSAPRTLLRLLRGNAARVDLLRHVAKDFSDHRALMVIQCKTGHPNSLYELASVEQFPSTSKRARYDQEPVPTTSPRRYFRWLNRLHRDLEQHDHQPNSDAIRLDSPIPWFYALNGYQWQNPPRSFVGPLLEEACPGLDWRFARGITVRSILAFGDPEQAGLYCITVHYWTALSPNIKPEVVGGPQYRALPNIFVMRHILSALNDKLLSREMLFEYLNEGRFSEKIWKSLKALQTASDLYSKLHDATVALRVAEQPLCQHQWIPHHWESHRHYPFAGFELSREQMFACISRFETGTFNFQPSAMNGVLAISSGNSIYVASCLLQDPCERRSEKTIERVVGNLGKTGMALLVCPPVPQVRSLSDDIRLVNHHPFDGNEEDSFLDTSLHLSYTEWQLPVDVGSRGKRDVEAYYVEVAIGVYDRGKWVADLNILDVFQHPLSRIIPDCTMHRNEPTPIDETSKFVTIDNWEELLDSPIDIGVFRARGNWQARLAAAALSIQRGHETRIVPNKTCWSCCLALERVPRPDTMAEDDAHVDEDRFDNIPWMSDEDDSESDTEEIVQAAVKRNKQKKEQESGGWTSIGNGSNLNRNIVYIL